MHWHVNLQGRRKLPKAKWASSTVGGTIGPLWLMPKPGWAISHSAHPSLTPLFVANASQPKSSLEDSTGQWAVCRTSIWLKNFETIYREAWFKI